MEIPWANREAEKEHALRNIKDLVSKQIPALRRHID
jgi:hypothetical protein